MDQYKDMLENKFCSNIAPSASTGPPTLQCKLQWAISQKINYKNSHIQHIICNFIVFILCAIILVRGLFVISLKTRL